MSRLIDADALNAAMYHEAFETDTDMQRWDSGCWIRYKMFERAIKAAPTIDAVEVVRCKECRFGHIDHCLGQTCWICGFTGRVTIGDGYCNEGVKRDAAD